MSSGAGTEDRLTALEEALRPLPEQVAKIATAVEHLTEETSALRRESREDLQGLREELRDEAKALRDEWSQDRRALQEQFSGLQGRLTQIGFALVGTLLAAIVAIVT